MSKVFCAGRWFVAPSSGCFSDAGYSVTVENLMGTSVEAEA
jgi:hypothetical protein